MKNYAGLGCAFLVGILLLAATGGASAQPSNESDQSKSAQPSEAALIRQLEHRLDERDAVIRELLRRTRRLERLYREQQHAIAAAEAERPTPPAPGPREIEAPAPTAPVPQAPAVSATAAAGGAPGGAPGQFTVSPEAAQHALERALVQTGALLLDPWKFEFVPSVSYQFSQVSNPDQLVITPGGTLYASEHVQRSTLIQSQALLRAGLPWDSQIEVGTSFDYANQSVSSRIPGSFISETSANGSGLGDSSITLIKQVSQENGWLPSLFISGTGNLGQTSRGMALGTGYDWVRASLLAVKRQDPLVFTAGLGYQTNFEKHNVKVGDEVLPSFGLLFAVSPETSLQFNQQVAFIQETKSHGVSLPGSSQIEGIFQAGVLSILAPNLVVNLTGSVAETPDAPDLTIQLSFPFRLN